MMVADRLSHYVIAIKLPLGTRHFVLRNLWKGEPIVWQEGYSLTTISKKSIHLKSLKNLDTPLPRSLAVWQSQEIGEYGFPQDDFSVH